MTTFIFFLSKMRWSKYILCRQRERNGTEQKGGLSSTHHHSPLHPIPHTIYTSPLSTTKQFPLLYTFLLCSPPFTYLSNYNLSITFLTKPPHLLQKFPSPVQKGPVVLPLSCFSSSDCYSYVWVLFYPTPVLFPIPIP